MSNNNNSGGMFNMSKRNKTLSWIMGIVVFIFVIYFIVVLVQDYNRYKDDSPYLVLGTKIAKNPLVVPGSKIPRSVDGKYGLEFTYSVWLYIEDSNFINNTDYKHILHKGSPDGIPLQSPGIWLYPTTNKLSINMNTFYSVKEPCDIANIPINKWFHLTIMVINKTIDVYINCNLKKRCKLKGVPKLNYGDLYVNLWGGFDGLLSNLRYWDRVLPQYELEAICTAGPSKAQCTQGGDKPPYLAQDYWMTTGFPNAISKK